MEVGSLRKTVLFAIVALVAVAHPAFAMRGDYVEEEAGRYTVFLSDYYTRTNQKVPDCHRERGVRNYNELRNITDVVQQGRVQRGPVARRPEPPVIRPPKAEPAPPEVRRRSHELLGSPTMYQEKCRREAPSKPSRIVLGFDGLASYNPLGEAMVRAHGPKAAYANPYAPIGNLMNDMIGRGAARAPDVHFKYFSQMTMATHFVTDPVRCAYELATKPYPNPDGSGKPVYSTITILGYSFGGYAAKQMAAQLKKLGISVDLVMTADPRVKTQNVILDGLFSMHYDIPTNVDRCVNYYEKNDFGGLGLVGYPVRGCRNIDVSDTGAWHLGVPKLPEVQNGIAREVANLPRCRTSFSESSSYGRTAGGCGATQSEVYAGRRAPSSRARPIPPPEIF
jgi:hypothetical protein